MPRIDFVSEEFIFRIVKLYYVLHSIWRYICLKILHEESNMTKCKEKEFEFKKL